jgi:hypothetical protein
MRPIVTEVEDHNAEPGRWHNAKKAIAVVVGRIQAGGYLDSEDLVRERATANKCGGRENENGPQNAVHPCNLKKRKGRRDAEE